ncbi:hypothetical protein QYF36_026043 [Acer negundo]|nr:hypothetical protein QYF36_026043 [Acer negundo]
MTSANMSFQRLPMIGGNWRANQSSNKPTQGDDNNVIKDQVGNQIGGWGEGTGPGLLPGKPHISIPKDLGLNEGGPNDPVEVVDPCSIYDNISCTGVSVGPLGIENESGSYGLGINRFALKERKKWVRKIRDSKFGENGELSSVEIGRKRGALLVDNRDNR